MDNYNDEPIFFCNSCLSLRVMSVCGLDYCDECGSTDIETCHVDDWRMKYRKRYGFEFLNK